MTGNGCELVVADKLDYGTARNIESLYSDYLSSECSPRDRRCHTAEYYIWKIVKNPYGRGFVSLAVDDGKIVGTITITRKEVWFDGQWVEAGELCDGLVVRGRRRHGSFSALVNATVRRAVGQGVRLIYGTPNDKSLVALEKRCLFFRKRGVNLYLWVVPLKPGRVVLRGRGKRGRSLSGLALDRVVGKALKCVMREGSGLVAKESLVFDDSFDRLDEVLRGRYDFMLPRRAKDLKYRLARNPDRERYGVMCKLNRGGSLTAVMIHKKIYQDGMKVFLVGDLYGMDRRSIRSVWSGALLRGIEEDYDLVATWMPLWGTSILSMLPFPALAVARKQVVFHNSGFGKDAVRDNGRWHFSILDSDNI